MISISQNKLAESHSTAAPVHPPAPDHARSGGLLNQKLKLVPIEQSSPETQNIYGCLDQAEVWQGPEGRRG